MLWSVPLFVVFFGQEAFCKPSSQTSHTTRSINDADVGFPEREHVDIDRNKTRVPLYIPGRCPINQLLYPGDQKSDWICDCMPGFIYYAPQNTCFELYRQGPCPRGEYLILTPGQFTPFCINNPCSIDGKAPYKGQCYTLLKPGGPCFLQEGGGIFGVNSTTLQPECLRDVDRISILYDAIVKPQKRQ